MSPCISPVQTSAASIAVTQHSAPNLDGTAFRQPLVGCFHRRAAASHHSGRPAFRRASAYIAGCFGCRYGPRTFWRALEIRTAGSIQSVSSLPHHAQLAAAIRNAASLLNDSVITARKEMPFRDPHLEVPKPVESVGDYGRSRNFARDADAGTQAQSAICCNAVLASLRSAVSNPSVNQL
jgi:hypothetical protein